MSAPSSLSSWKTSNLAAINQRLSHVYKEEKLEKVLQGDLQGIFLRKEKDILEMYCYDNKTQKLSNIMSRIDLCNPLNLLGPYSQAVFLSAFWQEQQPKNIYIAGFGGGRLAMLFHHYFPNITIDGTDIDPNVLDVARNYFGLGDDTLKGIKTTDSRKDLTTREKLYNIIFLDVFIGGGEHVNHLATREFFKFCKEKLTPKGVVVANLVIIDKRVHQKIAAMKAAFKYCTIWEFKGAHVIFASDKPINIERLCSRVGEFQKAESLNFDLLDKAQMLKPLKSSKTINALSDKDL